MTKEQEAALLAIRLLRSQRQFDTTDAMYAEEYAKRGYNELQRLPSGYNPRTDAPEMAQMAVVEYVKALLMEQSPSLSPSYNDAAQSWLHAAATENNEPTTY